MKDDFGDALVTGSSEDQPERFFDRWMLNLHPDDGVAPSLVVGAGFYPPRDVTDGFLVLSTATEQRNLRLSTHLSDTPPGSVGPLSWEVLEPMRVWRVVLAANPTGVELDLTWTARTAAWTGGVGVTNTDGTATSFDHLFQSGRYAGTLRIDGERHDVAGWWGQRDRSRGVRTMAGGQGLHLWVQAQLATMAIGFLHVEGRDGSRLLLEGAVMHEDGRLDDVTEVRHDLVLDEGLDLRSGVLEVRTASGASYVLDCDASARGGYMAGGGYGGHHGKDRGTDHVEHDVYPLDGSVSPRTVDTALVDRATRFTCGGETGYGILEFAVSRSSAYRYRSSLR